MSCPVCGERCTCSYAGAASTLIDPEEYDLSEQRFSASLNEVEAGRASGGMARRQRRDSHHSDETWNMVGAVAAPVANRQGEPQEASLGVDEGAYWRNEVASRVESYRARRRRPIRERSLPLDFERAVNRELTHGKLSTDGEEEARAPSPESPAESDVRGHDEPQPEREATPVEELAAAPPSQPWSEADEAQETKIIEFPRQGMLPVMPPSFEELAEPMIGRPRILEVPEEVETAAPLADISVAPEEQQPAVEFELPLQAAPMPQRVLAGMVDALIVLAGAAVFALIVSKAGVPMPETKGGFLLAVAAPCAFWAIYEYMFLMYAGTTPGMQIARVRLVTFDGLPVRRRSRRVRAIAVMLSCFALGLGILWALLDEDTLCWHDRITRTYVVAANP